MAQPVPPPRRDRSRSRSRSRHSYEGFVEKRGPRDQVGPGTEPRYPPTPPGTDPPPPVPSAARGRFPVAEPSPVPLPEGLGRAAGTHARLLRGTPGLRGWDPPRAETWHTRVCGGGRRRGAHARVPPAPGDAGPGRAGGRGAEGGGLVLRLRGQEVTMKHGAGEALQGEPRGPGLRHRRGRAASLLLAGRSGAVFRGEQQGQPAAPAPGVQSVAR
ncbi:signal-transducing adaptor protein 2 isoform X1 [Haliaeetus albicilla]|uniref:signal-transducing adaptor protein 2 isoform X1 n=1 Tax=Haliaeetus albicilla TaxID=8969 RepID=UPI0037E76E54